MTDDRVALIEAFQKADDGNFLRSLAETVLQILMEADVDGLIGAGRYERSGERSTYRNGYRERSLDTRLGSLNLKIPKLELCGRLGDDGELKAAYRGGCRSLPEPLSESDTPWRHLPTSSSFVSPRRSTIP